ncbi:porin, partial [Burkholderia sp. SIMBA_051]|uniref:porin n=1 Tax=Burkholderia sp. SIMBA_051 TaxID=3085792 RepID=UPI003979B40C
MKLKAPASFALSLAIGQAHAQGTVTLYGIVDEGVNWTSNTGGHTLYNLTSGGIQASRLGFRGLEDLGGGISVLFVL